MKLINKFRLATIALVAWAGLSGCLKNSSNYIDFSSVAPSIDLPLTAPSVVVGYTGNSIIQFSYQAGDSLWTYYYGGLGEYVPVSFLSGNPYIPVYVNVASPGVLGHSVTATLAIDTAYFNSYNANSIAGGGAAYTLMPDSLYTISSMNLTVAAGQRQDSVYVTFNFTQMNVDSVNYILPITIASSSLPIEQWNHLLLNVSQ